MISMRRALLAIIVFGAMMLSVCGGGPQGKSESRPSDSAGSSTTFRQPEHTSPVPLEDRRGFMETRPFDYQFAYAQLVDEIAAHLINNET